MITYLEIGKSALQRFTHPDMSFYDITIFCSDLTVPLVVLERLVELLNSSIFYVICLTDMAESDSQVDQNWENLDRSKGGFNRQSPQSLNFITSPKFIAITLIEAISTKKGK